MKIVIVTKECLTVLSYETFAVWTGLYLYLPIMCCIDL